MIAKSHPPQIWEKKKKKNTCMDEEMTSTL
jgi:hypothetical protein